MAIKCVNTLPECMCENRQPGRHTDLPDVSAERPCSSPNMLPHALLTAAILAMIGRLWMTKATSSFWMLARLLAWPRMPKPVTSVAPWASYLCMRLAAENIPHWLTMSAICTLYYSKQNENILRRYGRVLCRAPVAN